MKAKYCFTCGERVEVKKVIYAYDTDTGEPKTYQIRHCKKAPKSFWEWIKDRNHYADEPFHDFY